MKSRMDVNKDYELKLRRKVRLYKDLIAKRKNWFLLPLIIAVIYLFRGTILMVARESVMGYKFLGEKIISSVYVNITFGGASFRVEIRGLKNLQKEMITNVVSEVDQGIGGYNIFKIKERLEKMPVIKSVKVVRSLVRNSLSIDIQEREFIGIFTSGEGNLLGIDDSGILHNLESFRDLFPNPVVVQNATGYDEIIAIYSYLKYRGINNMLSEMVFISGRRWNIKFKNGLLAKLPAKKWHKAIDVLLYINQNLGVLSEYNKIVYIDLRIEGKVFLR